MREKSKQHTQFFLTFYGSIAAVAFLPFSVFAAWNLPSCDPDTVGPTDSSCNVAAPLNVSSGAQTKIGQLTIQNTVNAGALVVSSAYSGNGTVAITTSSGKSLVITHSDSVQSAITLTTSSNQTGVTIAQAGTGGGISVSSAGTSATTLDATSTGSTSKIANFSSNGTSAVGLTVAMTGSTAKAVDIDSSASGSAVTIDTTQSTATALAIAGTGGASTGINVTSGASGTGIVVNSTQVGINVTGTQYGISSTTSTGISVYGYANGAGSGVVGRSNSGRAGYFYSNTTSNVAVLIQNTSTGPSLNVESNAVSASAISYPSGWTAPTNGLGIRATSGNSIAVTGYSTANTGYGVGVYGRGTYDYGVVAYSDSDYGLFANTQSASYYGSASCNTMTANCAYLGGGTYAANLAGRLYVSASVTTNPVATIYNTNTSSPYGIGLSVRTMTGSLTALSVDQGTALEAQAYNGYGLFAYSQNGTAGVYGQASGASAYGGYFVASGATSAAIYASNTGNGGKGVVINTTGIGIDITTNTTTADGTGIVINATGGQKGIVIDASSTGIDVDTTSGLALQANDDSIQTTQGYLGGQFYPNEPAGNGVMPNVHLSSASGESIGTVGYQEFGADMIFDGSQLYVLTDSTAFTSKIVRYDVVTGQKIHESDTGFFSGNAQTMVLLNSVLYALRTNSADVYYEHIYSNTSGVGNKGVGGSVNAATTDGVNIWYGTNSSVMQWDLSTTAVERLGSIGAVSDIIFANGYVWAADSTNDVLYKILPESPYTATSISVGDNPQGLAYDGASIWVANYGNNTLTRVNSDTNSTSSVNVTSLGSGPMDLAFDGSKIWMTLFDSNRLGYYDIANSTLSSSFMSIYRANALVFDGARMWAAESTTSGSDSGDIYKVYTGNGSSGGNPTIRKGIMMYNSSGTQYCAWLDGSGAWMTSTTLTECE